MRPRIDDDDQKIIQTYIKANNFFNSTINTLIDCAREKKEFIPNINFKPNFNDREFINYQLTIENLKQLHIHKNEFVNLYQSLPDNSDVKAMKLEAQAAKIRGQQAKNDEEIYQEVFLKQLGYKFQPLTQYHFILIFDLLNSKNNLGSAIESLAIQKCFKMANIKTNKITPESVRIREFKLELIKLVNPELKYYHKDITTTPYRLTSYRLPFNQSVSSMIDEIKTMDDKEIRCLDLSQWNNLPNSDFLKQIPRNINKIIFPGIYLRNVDLQAVLFTWLPPHIKTIQFSQVSTPAFSMTPLGFFCCCGGSTGSIQREIINRFIDNLPFTLERVEGLRDNSEISNKTPSFPASYSTVFENIPEASVIQKMSFLLLHYLGKDSKSLADGSIKTWSRTNWRDHRAEVEGIIQRIQDNEFKEPIELLNALKEIAQDANPHGGLQRRIDYFSHYLATHPQEAQVLQAAGPSCSSH